MPVVSGFKSKMELAVMMVCKNMFSKKMEDNGVRNAKTAIRTWHSFVT